MSGEALRTRARAHTTSLAAVLCGLLACQAALEDHPGLVETPTIVAIEATPAEAPPGAALVLEAVVLRPSGASATEPLDVAWSWCRDPKPLGENGVVAPKCLAPANAEAAGASVMLALPADGCALFGPDTPQPKPGAAPTRPRDPDSTGGYFQPIVASLSASLVATSPTSLAVGLPRITCGLPNASLPVARAFRERYRPNVAPTIAALTLSTDAGELAPPYQVSTASTVTLSLTWTDESAETFPRFDPATGTLVDTTETLTTSWWFTHGTLTSRGERVSWRAPLVPTDAQLIVVLRDSRGASRHQRIEIAVR